MRVLLLEPLGWQWGSALTDQRANRRLRPSGVERGGPMRRIIPWVLVAAATGVVVGNIVAGTAAEAIVKTQAVIEQNNPAFHPFQTTVTPKSGFCQTIDVAAGNRLVIEQVTAYVEDATADFLTFSTVAGGTPVDHYVTLVQSQ